MASSMMRVATWSLLLVCVVSSVLSAHVSMGPHDEAGHWWPEGHPRSIAAQAAKGFTTMASSSDHFTYVRSDAGPEEWGPAHWSSYEGSSGSDGALCSGSAQSPINIEAATYSTDLKALSANWKQFEGTLVNNGHTIQVNIDTVDGGNGNLTGGVLSDPMQVVQFHVHYNSEHHLDGASYPLELHVVHSNTNKNADASLELAVVGFMFQESTTTSTFFEPIISALTTLNTSNSIEVSIDLTSLASQLPIHKYFNYKGSLTAPNCRETVTWYVMDTVLEIDGGQLDQIRNQFPINNRPIQALNGRSIRTNKLPAWGPWGPCDLGTGLQTRTCNNNGIVVCPTTTSTQICDAQAMEEAEDKDDKITTTQALSAATVAIAGALIVIVMILVCYFCCCRKTHEEKPKQQAVQMGVTVS